MESGIVLLLTIEFRLHGHFHGVGSSQSDDVALVEFSLLNLLDSMLFRVNNNSSVSSYILSEVSLIPETTSLLVAAINIIGIGGNFLQYSELGLITDLGKDLDVHLEIINVVHILNIFESQQLLIVKICDKISAEIVRDLYFAVLELLQTIFFFN